MSWRFQSLAETLHKYEILGIFKWTELSRSPMLLKVNKKCNKTKILLTLFFCRRKLLRSLTPNRRQLHLWDPEVIAMKQKALVKQIYGKVTSLFHTGLYELSPFYNISYLPITWIIQSLYSDSLQYLLLNLRCCTEQAFPSSFCSIDNYCQCQFQ